jgi:NitT/TauT family transport system substrate-binding protein
MVKSRHRRLSPIGPALALLLALTALAGPASAQVTKIKVGWCARTVSAAAAPYAIAAKLGWFRQEGIEVELVPMSGSTECVKNVAVREIDFALPSVEPLAIGRPQGIKAKVFYTAYQGNIYGIAVPQDSPVKEFADLRGKRIGVISMGSAGVLVARELANVAGLNPDTDINIVVAGEGAQTAAMVRGGQVDALSQFDTQYAMVDNAGIKLRLLDTRAIDRFPSNGFLALEETLRSRRKEAVGLTRSYAKGTIFAMANPEAAIRILWEVYPATKPTGKDEATALRDDTKVLQARAQNWRLEKADVKRWGESSEANYGAYAEFMLRTGIIKQAVTAQELVTNELIEDINKFDPEKIAAEARAYRAGG